MQTMLWKRLHRAQWCVMLMLYPLYQIQMSFTNRQLKKIMRKRQQAVRRLLRMKMQDFSNKTLCSKILFWKWLRAAPPIIIITSIEAQQVRIWNHWHRRLSPLLELRGLLFWATWVLRASHEIMYRASRSSRMRNSRSHLSRSCAVLMRSWWRTGWGSVG